MPASCYMHRRQITIAVIRIDCFVDIIIYCNWRYLRSLGDVSTQTQLQY